MADNNAGRTDETGKAQTGADAIAILTADHRQVEQMFEQYESANAQEKDQLLGNICRALTMHTMLEEEIFYPACREKLTGEEALDEAQVEHDGAKLLILDLESGGQDDRFRDAKVRVLAERIKHHVGEEEKPRQGIFARAKQAGVVTPDLGGRLQQRKAELEAQGSILPLHPISINNPPAKENDMPSSQTRERDDQGRFMSDDDRGRSYSSRGSGGRGRDEEGRFTSGNGRGSSRRDDDDDDRGRGGWFGDSRGHSEASRRGWDERGGGDERYGGRGRSSRGYDDDDRSYRSGSSGRYDDDDRDSSGRGRGGWFGDSEGHSEAARRGWDNPDHGPSGWYGDSRGHSEASRRGWDNPDHGPSGWYGDSRGHSEASRRGWDNPDHGRSGWYGDPEGHSEASRRGWDDRGRSRSSRGGRHDYEDDRGSRH